MRRMEIQERSNLHNLIFQDSISVLADWKRRFFIFSRIVRKTMLHLFKIIWMIYVHLFSTLSLTFYWRN